jgi:fatty-acid peroxygenase
MSLAIPRDPSLDSTVALLREGFPFILNRCRRLGTDIFQMRLLGMKTICLHGPEAVATFYDTTHFVRKGAIPKPVQKTLLGENGVQTLDDAAHRHRKAMFMSLMTPASIRRLLTLMREEWQAAAARWEQQPGEVLLFEEAQRVLCRAACAWAAVPLPEAEAPHRARDFATMVDAFGTMAPRHWRGRAARGRSEKWIRGYIRQVRAGQLHPPEGAPGQVLAWHRQPDGELLSVPMAAVELINVIRPIVAIAWYVTFAALALHQHPECRTQLQQGPPEYLEWFVHEVRRFYPFAPFTGARVRADFDWRGYRLTRGTLVLLDVYGTNRNATRWPEPETFRPERFRDWHENPFDFIPQGGGDFLGGHRCAGEWITIEATKVAAQFLAQLRYEVPPQDLSFSLARMPTFPRSKFRMRAVQRTAQPAEQPA